MRRAVVICLSAGSSLVVHPVTDTLNAKDNGAKLVILNREATPLDGYADLVLNVKWDSFRGYSFLRIG